MPTLPDESLDMILCDLPYGTTRNRWDTRLDLDALWKEYKRLIKPRGCIALFAQTPFDKMLGMSNIKMLKYEWIWEKPCATGFLNSKFAPLKCHENILIFSKSGAGQTKNPDKAMVYNPQFAEGKPYICKAGASQSENYNPHSRDVVTVSDGKRYPRDVIQFKPDTPKVHPTQKPVALLEYLINTYTDTGGRIMDNCMGSGSTGVACVNTKRDFMGIELDTKYFEIARDRIASAKEAKELV